MEHSGDRTLAAFVSRDNLEFSTYTYGLQGGNDWNVRQTIPYEDDLTTWFFMYFGYSFS